MTARHGPSTSGGRATSSEPLGHVEAVPTAPLKSDPAALLAALCAVAGSSLESGRAGEGLGPFLRALGGESGAGRAFLSCNKRGRSGRLSGVLVCQWQAEERPGRLVSRGRDLTAFRDGVPPRWDLELGLGKVVHACMSEVVAGERSALESLGALSVLLVPVSADGEWWGVLGLCDCLRERRWSPEEEDVMKATAAMVGAGIRRDHLSLALSRSKEQLRESEAAARRSDDLTRRTMESAVYALAIMAEQRDPYTAGHQRRVSELSCEIAKEMGVPEDIIEGIRIGALVHDVGKIGIPFELLTKPAILTQVELAIVKTHPEVGHSVLKTMDFPWAVADIALQHHEHLDGSGYPRGLRGEAIRVEARIVGVADVVEAMACHRPYRPALGLGAALEHVSREAGALYDPAVVDACLHVFYERGFKFADMPVISEVPPEH
jgi:hypothetical protein